MTNKKQKILISTSTFAKYDHSPIEKLQQHGIDIVENPYNRKLEYQEQIDLYKDIDGLIAGTEKINAEVLNAAKKLKVISRCGVGIDSIDLDEAKRLGIEVFNTPESPTLAVAELSIALILNMLRKVNKMDSYIRDGLWNKLMGNLLYGKKVGIIGFGRIGQKVAELVSVFRVEVSYYDIEPKKAPVGCKYRHLEDILGWADILVLHLSTAKGSKPILGRNELKIMKQGSWLVNLSRGGVVDEDALCDFLKKGHISGAAIDVFKQEPYEGPLKKMDNVILTPHVGSYAKEARIRMENEAVGNLLRGLKRTV